jgi:hypothetical protein
MPFAFYPPIGAPPSRLFLLIERHQDRALRGCPETRSLESLKDNILCHVLGKTKSGITG